MERKKIDWQKFAEDHLRPTLFERDVDVVFARDIFRKLGEHQFFMNIGSSVPNPETTNILNLAKGSVDIPFCLSTIAQIISIKLISQFGNESQKTHWLPSLQSGALIAGVANTERSSGTDLTTMGTKIVSGETGDILSGEKTCYTNGPADLLLLSAWCKFPASNRPLLGVYLIPGHEVLQKSISEHLMGFKTGLTGCATLNSIPIDTDHQRLGRIGDGFKIFKYCFDLERFFVGKMMIGILDAILLEARSYFGTTLGEKGDGIPQYLQQKIVLIYEVQTKLMGLCSLIEQSSPHLDPTSIHLQRSRLAVLKHSAIEDGLMAVNAFLEIFSFKSLMDQHVAQKLIRDMTHLKFLGGTKELQRMVIFDDLMNEHSTLRSQESPGEKKSA